MKRTTRRGMSLIEILLATALWSIGFMATISLFVTCRAAVVSANNIMAATSIAQTQIESLKFATFTDVDTQSEQATTVQSTFNGVAVRNTYYHTVTVTSLLGGLVKDVVVEVAWQEKGYNGSARTSWRSVKMESMITQ